MVKERKKRVNIRKGTPNTLISLCSITLTQTHTMVGITAISLFGPSPHSFEHWITLVLVSISPLSRWTPKLFLIRKGPMRRHTPTIHTIRHRAVALIAHFTMRRWGGIFGWSPILNNRRIEFQKLWYIFCCKHFVAFSFPDVILCLCCNVHNVL